ncbi:hypothetical protein DFH06DRAFT_1333822 [Mycena polygramma]|nr:hypothetical protein DFH06DRAFT_1333822 [Mycena polygramma]
MAQAYPHSHDRSPAHELPKPSMYRARESALHASLAATSVINYHTLEVVLETEIYVYDISNMQLLHVSETPANPDVICALSPSADVPYLAYPAPLPSPSLADTASSTLTSSPASATGCGDVFLFSTCALVPANVVRADRSPLAILALSPNGGLLATVSVKGALLLNPMTSFDVHGSRDSDPRLRCPCSTSCTSSAGGRARHASTRSRSMARARCLRPGSYSIDVERGGECILVKQYSSLESGEDAGIVMQDTFSDSLDCELRAAAADTPHAAALPCQSPSPQSSSRRRALVYGLQMHPEHRDSQASKFRAISEFGAIFVE